MNELVITKITIPGVSNEILGTQFFFRSVDIKEPGNFIGRVERILTRTESCSDNVFVSPNTAPVANKGEGHYIIALFKEIADDQREELTRLIEEEYQGESLALDSNKVDEMLGIPSQELKLILGMWFS